MEKAVGMKKDEEREWVMGPTNIAVSIPLFPSRRRWHC